MWTTAEEWIRYTAIASIIGLALFISAIGNTSPRADSRKPHPIQGEHERPKDNMKILISACLLGENCKYDGGNNLRDDLVRSLHDYEIVPVCPEVLGGLSTPRVPAEIADGIVTTREGRSVDAEFRSGAQAALRIAQEERVDLAILQSRSPSCGVRCIYDGTFTGTIVEGMGVFAQMMAEHGFQVMDVEDALDALGASSE